LTDGIKSEDLWIWAGSTGSGKSIALSNMACNIWMQQNTIYKNPSEYLKGYNVLYFSLEMGLKDCFSRVISKIADVRSYGIRDAALNVSEAESLGLACKFIKNYKYHLDIIDLPRGASPKMIESIYNQRSLEYKVDVIIVDYMGIMGNVETDQDQDWLALGQIAASLHEITRIYKIGIISACQSTRIDNSQKKIN